MKTILGYLKKFDSEDNWDNGLNSGVSSVWSKLSVEDVQEGQQRIPQRMMSLIIGVIS